MKERCIDLTNHRFGKLLVLSKNKLNNKREMYWKCLCDCGNETIVRSRNLREGKTQGCGCNSKQSQILKFKKENPFATYQEMLKIRLSSNSKFNGECIEWTGRLTNNGYGHFRYKNKIMHASRASWISHHGEISKEKLVLHICDNPKCININHLFLGSHKENTIDMIKKGREDFGGYKKKKYINSNLS